MPYLLDNGILLRLIDETDSQHATVRDAVDVLVGRRDDLLITTQYIAEFWNVASRSAVNNGLELPPDTVARLFEEAIEPICAVLPELDALADEFKRLLTKYGVTGKQVHDARLAAMMLTWQIDSVLTLNERNFRRFEPEGIAVVSPATFIAPRP